MRTAEGIAAPNPRRSGARRFRRTLLATGGDLLPLFDFTVLLLAGFLSLGVFREANDAPAATALNRLIWIAAVVAPFVLYDRKFSEYVGVGNGDPRLIRFFCRFLVLVGMIWAISFASDWLIIVQLERLAFWLSSALLLMLVGRVGLAGYLRKLEMDPAHLDVVAVVGVGRLSDKLIPVLKRNAVLFGVFDDACSDFDGFVQKPETSIAGLIAHAEASKLDRIVLAMSATDETKVQGMIDRLRPLGVPIELCPQTLDLGSPFPVRADIGDGIAVTLLADRPIRRWNASFKNAQDSLLSIVIIVAILPLLIGIAVAIKLDSPGPILFRQRRHGMDNREFDIYKFRTMHCLPDLFGNTLAQTVRGDGRITGIGRFLRKFSLDELPQLLNVIEGTMSLVGPRPHAVNMRTEAKLGLEITRVYRHRHRVRPGITGWAQVNGFRGATHTVDQLHRRVELDLFYIENWSPLLDLKILCLTIREVLRARNAY